MERIDSRGNGTPKGFSLRSKLSAFTEQCKTVHIQKSTLLCVDVLIKRGWRCWWCVDALMRWWWLCWWCVDDVYSRRKKMTICNLKVGRKKMTLSTILSFFFSNFQPMCHIVIFCSNRCHIVIFFSPTDVILSLFFPTIWYGHSSKFFSGRRWLIQNEVTVNDFQPQSTRSEMKKA